MNILVTGCAGFIGYHLSNKLLLKKNKVIGIDIIDNYYSIKLKKERLKNLKNFKNFIFHKLNIVDFKKLNKIFKKNKIDCVVHLAAQPGVRYSYENPKKYFDDNIIGFYNVLEISRQNKIKNIIFASSSSVYGNQKKQPVTENAIPNPISFYGYTKYTNEILAKSYSEIFNLNIKGIRYFTVYGPYGRPDMALFKFLVNIKKNIAIKVFNYGKHKRDFTFINDAIEATYKIIKNKNKKFEIYNISSGKTIKLLDFINAIKKNLNKKIKINFVKNQPGDVLDTYGNINKIKKLKYKPQFNINSGILKFIKWFDNKNYD